MRNLGVFKLFVVSVLLVFISMNTFAQKERLRKDLHDVVNAHSAIVGFSLLDLQTGDTITVNGKKQLPMQSVYKFPLALAVLNQVDKGKLRLDQKIMLKKSDMLTNTWSPLRDEYPDGGVELPLSEILDYTVSESDNNGCDILFRLIGGPAKVNQYIHSIGVKNIAIVSTEEEMHADDQLQFKNWTTAYEATRLLKLFNSGKLLSKTSQAFLWKIMTETAVGAKKIKGLLPAGTLVTHKTGFSGTDKSGLTAASNDVGIVTLPNGKKFALAVFVSMTKEEEKTIDHIIASLAKLSWDYMLSTPGK